ncbi:hypothetical protein D9M68_444540 [compost metagenome]
MQGFQLAEELAGGERIERCAAQPLAQRLEQPRHQLQQLLTRFRPLVRLDAPDQVVHGRQCRLPLGRLHPMLQAGQHQHLAPGLLQQAHHHFGQGLAQQPLVERVFDLAPGHRGLGAALLGIAGALLEQFAAPALIANEGEEVGQQLGKDRRIVDEIVEQALHHLLDLLVQAVALHVALLAPAQGRRSDLIEQTPGWMATTTEEGLVQHRDLQHRNLQTTDQRLQGVRQGAIVEDELEEHRHQVDDVLVDLAHDTGLAALDAGATEQLLQLQAQVEVVLGLHRQTLLQVREQPGQIVTGDRQRIGRQLAARHGHATDLRQQLLQGTEYLLNLAPGVGIGDVRRLSRLGGAAAALVCSTAAGRSGLELRQDPGGHQHLVGLVVQGPDAAEHVLLEQLEDDQLDLDLHPEAAAGLEERIAQGFRTEWIGLVVDFPGNQRIQARGQVPQRQGVAAHDLGDHRVDGHALFQLVVLNQRQAVERHGVQLRRLADLVLVEGGERLEDPLQEAALDVLALQAQVAHGFEEGVLLGVAGGPIGHLEQGIVSVVEQRLQCLLELLCSLVAHMDQRHGQSSYRRVWRVLRGTLVEVHHFRVGHCESPTGRAT